MQRRQALLSRLHTLFQTNPVRGVVLACIVCFPLILLLAWGHTTAWKTRTIIQAVAEARHQAALEEAEVLARVQAAFDRMRKLSRLLAGDGRVVSLLRQPTPALLGEFDRYLQEFARDLDLHRVFILAADGRCVASNDFANAESLVSRDFRDREYFSLAMSGQPATQFVVGRVSTVPGFHFATPVRDGGEILGVATAKIDLPTLAKPLHFTSGFITDDQGIIVLANDPGHLLMAVPDAPALALPPEERLARYQRVVLPVLPIASYTALGVPLFTPASAFAPAVLRVARLPDEGLHLYLFQPVAGLPGVETQFPIRLALAVLVMSFVLVVGLSLLGYLVRDSYLRRNLVRLNEQLRHQAQHDALTGCANRRRFAAVMAEVIRVSARDASPVALAMIDLDLFKLVNDRYGHGMGDSILCHVAGLLQRHLRAGDVLARLGGEEFAVILPGVEEVAAAALLERIRAMLAATPYCDGEIRIRQTVSIGVSAGHGDKTPEKLQHEADIALYVAKHCGRNQVVAASAVDKRLSLQDLDDFDCQSRST
ncbi:diguanylate cyclase/phosphodiesterase (GGDEF & EAL domains) with PAS/PAC sensor(s) [Desulfovibrio sp. DV]|uniref:sensor domain-containing diguanylate cyclase n=1 Tax=Desulfovibrio sp. DV TaxID=1844708 RepID=UPI00094B8AFE|nr:sensor domain-containing diguanylate cyclase [Desulfovibrio sp. DV]OLN29634.1 diguanylate cyclase/phosphodiesterase (GGDEF & EAL domains) with PAS/PAC sensor(s) [Desulfovibrio sp. DV]